MVAGLRRALPTRRELLPPATGFLKDGMAIMDLQENLEWTSCSSLFCACNVFFLANMKQLGAIFSCEPCRC